MIGMGAEASTIVRAVAVDFFYDCWAEKIPSDERVGDVPGSIHYHVQGPGFESLKDFDVGGASSDPELYTIGPDGFENCFIEESEQPMHFCEGKAELFPSILADK
jgi:hypothetical protein